MPTTTYYASSGMSFRERIERERARDYGWFFCVFCNNPIRGTVCYRNGSACHYGCGAEHGDPYVLESLEPCQELALKNVREATKALHDAAVPRLRDRMRGLGFAPDDLDVTLVWIRDQAPIIIHVDLEAMGAQLAADTHYRNQFETNTSRGALSHETRMRWESSLFDNAYVDAPPAHRCKYGVLNVTSDPQGVRSCSNYGTSYLLLRNVRLRTTFAARDSGGINIEDLATVDYYAHVLEKYSDEELQATVEVSTRRVFGRDSQVIKNYKEAQIHGEVNLAENVEVIMAHPSLLDPRHHDMIQQLARRCNAPIVWMEGGDARVTEPHTGTHDGAEDEDVARAIAASRSLSHGVEDDVTRAIEASRTVSHCSHDDTEEDAIRRAISASHESVEEEKALKQLQAAEEANELERILELSKQESQAALTNSICEAPKTVCANGCGRLCAEGFPTCCRTCGATGGTKHGPVCEELAEAIRLSEMEVIMCGSGCGRQAAKGNSLCWRCSEEDEMARAIQASQEEVGSHVQEATACTVDPMAEFTGMVLRDLKQRARDEGVEEEKIDAADDTDDPKVATIQLIRVHRQAKQSSNDTLFVENPFAIEMALQVAEDASVERSIADNAERDLNENKAEIRKERSTWACPVCTLVNKVSDASCDVCETPRPQAIDNDEEARKAEQAEGTAEAAKVEAAETGMAEARVAEEAAKVSEDMKLEDAVTAEEPTMVEAVAVAHEEAGIPDELANSIEEAKKAKEAAFAEEVAMVEAVQAAEEVRKLEETAIAQEEATNADATVGADEEASGVKEAAECTEEVMKTEAATKDEDETNVEAVSRAAEAQQTATPVTMQAMQELEAAKCELAAKVAELEAKLAENMKADDPAKAKEAAKVEADRGAEEAEKIAKETREVEEAGETIEAAKLVAPRVPANAEESAEAMGEAGEDLQMVQTIKATMGQDTRRTQVTYSTDAAGDEVVTAITDAVKFIFMLPRTASLVLQYKDQQDGELLTLAETTVRDFLESQHGSTGKLFVRMVDSCNSDTSPATESESNSKHFIGYDGGTWDDFEHVDDPLADWYENPCEGDAKVVATECSERADMLDQ